MFQVALISALSAAVLVAALLWSMRVSRGISVPNEVRRVLIAIERASLTAIKRRVLRLHWPALAALALLLSAPYVLRSRTSSFFDVISLLGSIAVLASGLMAGLLVTWLASTHVRRSTYLSVSGAAFSADRSVAMTMASAAVLTIGAEVLGILGATATHGLLWLVARGDAGGAATEVSASLVAVRIGPIFGIGAALASIGVGQTGIACVGAAQLTGSSAFEARTGLPGQDPRNPAVLVEAVARQLGDIAPRVLDGFLSGTLIATLSFQLAHFASHSTQLGGFSGIAMLPLLVRSFGLLASFFGVATLRAGEHEDLGKAYARSQLVTHVVLGSAVLGVVVWLLGGLSIPIVVACTVGLLLASALGRLRSRLLGVRLRPPRPSVDDSPRAPIGGGAEAISVGLFAAVWPALAYPSVFAVLAFLYLRVETSLVEKVAGTLLAFSIPSSVGAWNLAAALGRDLHALGQLSASVGRSTLSEDAVHRLRRLRDSASKAAMTTETVFEDSGVLLCALAAIVCQLSHAGALQVPQLPVTSLLTVVLWVFVPGLFAAAAALNAGTKTARTQANEIDRQLRGLRRDTVQIHVPEDFVPSYRSCVELLARDSAQGGMTFAVLPLAFPLLCAFCGPSIENSAGLAAVGLASYAAIAAAAGLFATQVGHAATAASSLANLGSPPVRLTSSPPAVSVSEPLRLVSFMGQSLGVSTPLLTKAVALATLAFSPLLV